MGQAVRMVSQVVGVIVLSRLLKPEDFGLVAMVAAFVALADLLKDFGLPSAALQAKDLTHQQASNLFWGSLALATTVGLALTAATPLIVALYSEPRLVEIVPALAGAVVINGAQAQIQVQLARALRFATLAINATAATVIGLLCAIGGALAGLGHWALVIQPLATALSLLVLQSLSARWKPARPRRHHGSRALFTSGAQLGLAYTLTWAASNVDTLATGARWGTAAVGFYNRGFQVTVQPVTSLLSPLTQVAIPSISNAVQKGIRSVDVLLKLQFLVAGPVAAAMVAIAATAPSLVPLLLGPEWTPAVPVVQFLALGECVHALSFVSYWGFLAEKRSKDLLLYNLVSKPIAIGLVLLGSTYGVAGVAAGYAAGLLVSWPINLAWLARVAAFPAGRFFARGIRVLASVGAAFAIVQLTLGAAISAVSWGAVLGGACLALAVWFVGQAVFPSGRRDLLFLYRTVRAAI